MSETVDLNENADRALSKLRPLVAGNPWGQADAIRSAADFLLSRYEGARCDSDGVSSCVRCSTVYLAMTALDLVRLASCAEPSDPAATSRATEV